MASNHKLTSLIKGRTIKGTSNADNKMAITFHDDSVMTVRTAGNINSASTGGTIKGVRQQGTDLSLDFEEGGTLSIPLAEATSSVMVRDKNHAMEYSD